MTSPHLPATSSKRSSLAKIVLAVLTLLVIAALTALGIWQVERLAWKRDLIARVDARIHATPAAPPERSDWPGITTAADEYRRITVTGVLSNDKETLVQASTELGPGFWVLTPLRLADGTSILINRGFVPPERRNPDTRGTPQEEGTVTIVGLLRLSEAGGSLLQSNKPEENRWYSRDVAAIAKARGVSDIAPYFLDQEATAPGVYPVGGLTRIVFPDNHLVYAVTWFSLALMLSAGLVLAIRLERRARTRTA